MPRQKMRKRERERKDQIKVENLKRQIKTLRERAATASCAEERISANDELSKVMKAINDSDRSLWPFFPEFYEQHGLSVIDQEEIDEGKAMFAQQVARDLAWKVPGRVHERTSEE